MQKNKNILTTGDVARICHVAPRTVSKWFDNGQLRGYRIPGSKDRRIPLSELIRFMKVHNIPTDDVQFGKLRVLIADDNQQSGTALADTLRTRAGYEVQLVGTNFEAGLAVQRFAPHVLLVNLLSNNINAADLCKGIRLSEDSQTIKIVAIANHLNQSESLALLQNGFDGYISNGDDVVEIIKRVEEVTAIIY
jgi:excisionase family DNA binding protein